MLLRDADTITGRCRDGLETQEEYRLLERCLSEHLFDPNINIMVWYVGKSDMFEYMTAQESEKKNVSIRWVRRISKKSD